MVKEFLPKALKLPDEYDLKARVFPAFLALVPVAAVAFGCYDVELKVHTAFTGLLAYLGVFYLLANMSREFGKRHQDRLFAKWGGSPSTQLLRHSNTAVDTITKTRYHQYLEKALGVQFPNAADEVGSPAAADQVYEGAVRWLLTKTRDKNKFSMLFSENIAYGFRRNGYGIRWVAILVSVISVVWCAFVSHVVTFNGVDASKILDMTTGQTVAIAVGVAAVPVWLCFFTERTIRTASFSYADSLLRCCDSLPKKR